MKKVYYDAGNRIRYLREKQHYTREQLAEMADISPKFLYEIESGQRISVNLGAAPCSQCSQGSAAR